MGDLQVYNDSLREGIESLETAMRLFEDGDVRGHLANALIKLDPSSAQAESLFKEILVEKSVGWEAQEFFTMAYIRLAEIFEARRMPEAAIEYYQKFLVSWKDGDIDATLKKMVKDKLTNYSS